MIRILISMVFLVALLAVLSGCGRQDPAVVGTTKLGSLEQDRLEQQKLTYQERMSEAVTRLENPDAMPLQRAVNTANGPELRAAAQRWDASLQVMRTAEPPREVADIHGQLVQAMQNLSRWNHRIANAAPRGASATKAVARRARASPAAKRWGQALDALASKGYTFEPQNPPLPWSSRSRAAAGISRRNDAARAVTPAQPAAALRR